VKLINTDGMAFIGPGSEWFWTALSGIVLAVTFLAIYRQLRLQRSRSAIEQLDGFQHEWGSERMVMHSLDAYLARRDRTDPADLPQAAVYALANFWDKLGLLCRTGHFDPKLVGKLYFDECVEIWVLLAPCIKRRQVERSDPHYFEHFEWLAGVMSELGRRTGAPAFDEATLTSVLGLRINLCEDLIRVERALRSVIVASPDAPTVGQPPVPAAAQG
jgi:hypothetical protein